MRTTLLAGGFALTMGLLASSAFAADTGVTVTNAWARATAPHAMAGGAFMTLTAQTADALVSVSSPVAKSVEVHETVNAKGVMKMLPVPSLALPAGTPVTLKPGGYHIMLMGLKEQLKQGSSFPMTLNFKHAGPMTVTVTVAGPGASGPMMHGMPGMTHKP